MVENILPELFIIAHVVGRLPDPLLLPLGLLTLRYIVIFLWLAQVTAA